MTGNGTAKVLVIEDDLDGLRSVVDAVRDAGHTVVTATTGQGGLDAVSREQPDVVLSDRSMIAGAPAMQEVLRQMTADELGLSTRTIQRKIRDYNLPF